jgi:hypothetical protein
MFVPVLLAALAAVVFYALLPVAGAFVVRGQWRQFRKSIAESALFPELTAARAALPAADDAPGRRGAFRVQGEVDAIGGQHELWISGRGPSCVVDLRDSWVYVLSGQSGEDRMERRRWSGLASIGAGTRVFAVGRVALAGGRLLLAGDGRQAPLVVIHDGDDDGFARRAVWAGRHINEYWNPLTQVSLALGVATMSLILTAALPSSLPSLIRAMTITVAFSPVLALLTPGVAGFFLYRRYWRRARYCRARRDTESLDGAAAAMAETWKRRAYGATAASMLALASALLVNGWLLVFALRRFL